MNNIDRYIRPSYLEPQGKPPAVQAIPEDDSLALMYGVARVGEEQRQRTVEHLAQMFGQGYMDESTHDARREYALKAVTSKQLLHVISDLPSFPGPQALPEYVPGSFRSFIEKNSKTFIPAGFIGMLAFFVTFIIIPSVALPHGGPAVWKDIIISLAAVFGGAGFITTIIALCNWADS